MEGEQHFILRVQNPELAERLRRWLRDSENIEEVRLLFDTGKWGVEEPGRSRRYHHSTDCGAL